MPAFAGVQSEPDVAHDGYDEWDHVFSRSTTTARKVILYGSIGTKNFCAFHAHLSRDAQSQEYTYAVRHAFPGEVPVSATSELRGFGVFLDIKNMEYKAVDDAKTAATVENVGSGEKVVFLTIRELYLFCWLIVIRCVIRMRSRRMKKSVALSFPS